MRTSFLLLAFLLLAVPVRAQEGGGTTLNLGYSGTEAILPPEPEWNGRSKELLVPPSDSWATAFEKGGLNTTSGYDETVAWLRKLADASPRVKLVSLGKSGDGRDVWMAVVSAEGASTPEALHASGKPVLLAQAGIHAGEIDGKDAGMMLLRDLTVRGTKKALLDGASVLFVPVLNVDGFARFSKYNRINQRGPEETGWRVDDENLNLNRDWTKLDTPEIRAMVAMVRDWAPDLWIDLHVTDGEDYQYDITWGYNGPGAFSPNQAAWLDAYFTPAVTHDLKAWGHVPGPLVFSVDPTDMTRGIRLGASDPRMTHGYGDARHIATVLVEDHSLKSYARRVLGDYVLLETALRTLGEHGKELARAAATDRKTRRSDLPLGWKTATSPSETMQFLGIRSRRVPSAISGGVQVIWTGDPVTLQIPVFRDDEPETTVRLPKAYWIPPAWKEIADRVALHGITVETVDRPTRVEGTWYRLGDAAIDDHPYEGRVRVKVHPVAETETREFPAGSYRVSTDQPLGELAGLLLEPGSPDSFFQWGFMLSVIETKEYVEGYVMEPMAARMMAEMPGLAEEFNRKLIDDPAFAADPRARLDWFYRKTPFFDAEWRVYPVAREE